MTGQAATVPGMEELRSPDGTVRSFRPRLAAYYKDRGWVPTKQAKTKTTGRKAASGSVDTDKATDSQEN